MEEEIGNPEIEKRIDDMILERIDKMRDKITVYGLLSKIYNGNTDMPKKICFCGYDYEWDNDFKDYLRTDDERQMTFSFLETHNDNLMAFLQDTVDIIQDNKIELDLYTNARCGKRMTTEEQDYNWELISKNFEIINKKLNEVLNEKDR